MILRHKRLTLILLLLFGLLGVVSTYTRLSVTADENFHIACGVQWWRDGIYTLQPLHPPLARIADAALPYLTDHTVANSRDSYVEKMILGRLGALPFYLLSCIMVYGWSRKLFGELPALLSLGFYVTLSTVTAHAALATTDMAYTSMFLLALYCGVEWLKISDLKRSLWLGVSLGLMTGSKFSALAQWPAAMTLIVAGQYYLDRAFPLTRRHLLHMLIVLPLAALVLGCLYRFDFGPFIDGINAALRLNREGFGLWFYGPLDNHDAWAFFPVVFFFKTPLAFLAAVAIGNDKREKLFPLLAATGVMLVSMGSHIHLGVRHVLPVYPLLAIVSGYGAAWLWTGGPLKRLFTAVLLSCQLSAFILAYPEHLAYFNILAGDHPEHISLDSDYDWGQDMILLDEALQELGIDHAAMCSRPSSYWNAAMVVHARISTCPDAPMAGWVAVGRATMQLSNNIAWLKSYETLQIENSTMDLYYIPPKTP